MRLPIGMLGLSWIAFGGCSASGALELGDPGAPIEGDTDTDTDADADTEPDVEPYEWAGEFEGGVAVYTLSDWSICTDENKVELSIDESGVLTGVGKCVRYSGATVPLSFNAQAAEDGEINGEIEMRLTLSQEGEQSYVFDLYGAVGEDGVWLDWDDEVAFDYYEVPVSGEVWAE